MDKQRYGAYFENEKTASTFTGAIAEGLQEIRSGVFSAKNNNQESTIDRHTGAIKEKISGRGGGHGPGGRKTTRRKSLAQFADVNEAIASLSVASDGGDSITVTETLDLGSSMLKEGDGGEGRHSDISTEGTVVSSTIHSEDLNYDLAIEKQVLFTVPLLFFFHGFKR